MRLELSEADWTELVDGELKCICAVSRELREELARSRRRLDRPQLLRSWGRYLHWHELESGGPLEGIAEKLGMPLTAGSPAPGTQV